MHLSLFLILAPLLMFHLVSPKVRDDVEQTTTAGEQDGNDNLEKETKRNDDEGNGTSADYKVYTVVKRCNHPLNTGFVGPCEAATPMWSFNMKLKKCQNFTYGGCKGSHNKFDSLEECNRECIKDHKRDCIGKKCGAKCNANSGKIGFAMVMGHVFMVGPIHVLTPAVKGNCAESIV